MAVKIPINFPTDAEQRLRRAARAQAMTTTQRLQTAAALGDMVRQLAVMGGRFEAQQRLRHDDERQWRQSVQRLIARQLHA